MRVCVVINVFGEHALLQRLLGQVAEHMSGARVVIVPDEPRLKQKLTGEWTQRYLDLALASPTDVILKLDPDTCVWRPPVLPGADWFGTIANSRTFIRGGAMGMSSKAAKNLAGSGLLLQPSPHHYARYGAFRWPWEPYDETPISCQDRIIGDAMAELNYTPTEWSDVRILGNDGLIPRVGCYSITHPHPRLAAHPARK